MANEIQFVVGVESLKTAEKAGQAKAYLARLGLGLRSSIDRDFAPKVKALNTGNRRAFAMRALPGDVFEARRWSWTGEKYVGGTCWFGVQADGSLFEMNREEAFASLKLARIASTGSTAMPALQRAQRFAIPGVAVRLASEIEAALDAAENEAKPAKQLARGQAMIRAAIVDESTEWAVGQTVRTRNRRNGRIVEISGDRATLEIDGTVKVFAISSLSAA